jgi:hypothetical protein
VLTVALAGFHSSRPGGDVVVAAWFLTIGGAAGLVFCAVNWDKPDLSYERVPNSPFFGPDGWKGMRRSILPDSVTVLLLAANVFGGQYWSDTFAVTAALLVALLVAIGLTAWVFLYNRPVFLVRRRLRDEPGYLQLRRQRKALP